MNSKKLLLTLSLMTLSTNSFAADASSIFLPDYIISVIGIADGSAEVCYKTYDMHFRERVIRSKTVSAAEATDYIRQIEKQRRNKADKLRGMTETKTTTGHHQGPRPILSIYSAGLRAAIKDNNKYDAAREEEKREREYLKWRRK